VLHAAAEPEADQEPGAPVEAGRFAALLASRLEPNELATAIVMLGRIPEVRALIAALREVA
jgi:hypothetical protein